jgi:hypothetical protein
MLCYWAYGANFFADVFLAERQYAWSRMFIKSAPVIAALIPMLLISGRLVNYRIFDSRLDFILLAVFISMLVGMLQRSGRGVDYNAHFEFLISLCLAVGIVVALSGDTLEEFFWLKRAALLVIPFFIMVPLGLKAERDELMVQHEMETSWQDMQNRIASIPGPVACQNLALCYWAGKGFEIDFFIYGQRALIQHDTSILQKVLVSQRLSAVEISSVGDGTNPPDTGSDPIPSVIYKYYPTVLFRGRGEVLLGPNSGGNAAD